MLVEWSPSKVRLFDPHTGAWVTGASLGECLRGVPGGRSAVIAIGHRSAFIRTVSVPTVAKEELTKIVALKLAPLMPLKPNEYVFGYRVSGDSGAGKTAIVGAVKTEFLRRIYDEAQAGGLRIAAVVPLAFGSWLAARAHNLNDGLVVHASDASLDSDVISHGELRYSRSIPLPETREEMDEEVNRTFAVAEAVPGRVLAMAETHVRAEDADPREPIEYLDDVQSIQRQLFNLELPEKAIAREKAALRAVAQRAVFAAAVAIAFATFVYLKQSTALQDAKKSRNAQARELKIARSKLGEITKKRDQAENSMNILLQAFQPAQTFGDIVATLQSKASAGSWFTGLSIERGKPILIHGQATNGKSVSTYIGDLKKERRFREMKLISAGKSTVGKTPVVEFAASGHAVGFLPIDRVVARKQKL